jgi:hypothetical protein
MDLIATIFALTSALIALGLSVKQNIALTEENAWLRKRNKDMRKQMENMAELPW